MLAGVGVSWLTRLEQGSASAVSASVLDALAAALRLDEAGRMHLHHLAGLPARPDADAGADATPGVLDRLVAALAPNPAYVLDPRWSLVAWNEALAELIPSLAARRHGVSFLEVFLTDPDVREVVDDWEEQARRVVTQFRSHAAEFPGPDTERVIDTVSAASPLFARVWREHDVDRFQTATRSFTTEGVHRTFEQHRMALTDQPGWTLTLFVPAVSPG